MQCFQDPPQILPVCAGGDASTHARDTCTEHRTSFRQINVAHKAIYGQEVL